MLFSENFGRALLQAEQSDAFSTAAVSKKLSLKEVASFLYRCKKYCGKQTFISYCLDLQQL